MKASHLLLLALPLWLASCSTGLDLMGERAIETDEFYLAGGEPHLGDDAIDQARAEQWADEYGDYADSDYDNPYAAYLGDRRSTQSRLWNRYTPGWASGYNSGFGNPYYGSPYGYGSMGTGGWGSYGMGWGNGYGANNMAFMNGYDAWGNPIGGFGNPGFGYGWGNGWGYDPWGIGYNGYNPYYGNLGGYGNPWGGFCGTGTGSSGGISTFTPPSPRPNLGQFNGNNGYTGGSQAGGSGMSGSDSNAIHTPRDTSPAADEGRNKNRGRWSTTPEPSRTEPQRTVIERQEVRDRNSRSNGQNNWSAPSPSPNRGGSFSQPSSRPSMNTPSAPRPSSPRTGSGRSGRGG
jgi:hypothetical protein